MADLRLGAQVREMTGRKVKYLRREGLVPVVVYGNKQEPENLQVDAAALDRLLLAGGSARLVRVDIDGSGQRNILIRSLQRHPVRNNVIHADFYAVNMTEMQHVSVPLTGVRHPENLGADLVLVQSLDSIEIEALPATIPGHIEVDVSSLVAPDSPPITVADLPAMEGVTYLTAPDETIFSVVVSRAAIEEEEEIEEVEAEPEVIGREGEETEEAGEEASEADEE
jgi:large subunit ribosomal protein L25